MSYSIEQEISWKEYLQRFFRMVYKIRYIERLRIVEAIVEGGMIRCYIRPNGELIPFYFISKEFTNYD